MLFGLDQSANYYLYYRSTEGVNGYSNHIISDNESICQYQVDVPESDSLTTLSEIDNEEWSKLLKTNSDLCTSCRKRAVRGDIVPDRFVGAEQENQIPDNEVRPPVEGYHIYYQKATSTSPNPRDHIVDGEEALCNYGINVSIATSLKPFEEVSDGEWALLLGSSSNLCGDCLEVAGQRDIFPEDVADEPEYKCPYCDKAVLEVDLGHIAYVKHGSTTPGRGTVHKVPREHYEEWRRINDT